LSPFVAALLGATLVRVLRADLITALLVLVASNFGMPVSTTHVFVGTIAGVVASANTLDKSVVRNVLLSWLATPPISAAAAFAAGSVL
jgi:PiT family inorganic phosphate transporter